MSQTIVKTIDDDAEKLKLLNKTELDEVDKSFSLNSLRVLASRYLIKNDKGEIIESPKQLFERVATHVAIADILHDKAVFSKEEIKNEYALKPNIEMFEEMYDNFEEFLFIGRFKLNKYHFEALLRLYNHLADTNHMKVSFNTFMKMFSTGEFFKYQENVITYYNLMASKDFMPNTPCLANSGTRLGQLSACFVLPVQDNLNSIMESAKEAALIFQSGGGVGINYSNLRPQGAPVSSTHGVASGPVSFMGIVDQVTNVVKQGGKRRGANMGILDWNHKDVQQFVTAKKVPKVLENFNVSVATDTEFWNKLAAGDKEAEALMQLIGESAWASGEPGMLFFDNINKNNILMEARKVPLKATNPCSEQSLYPYESCNLGSINLANFVEGKHFDWKRYAAIIQITTRFLDNVIDMNKYPMPALYEASFETRRVGLGIMGLADALFKMEIPYDSGDAFQLMDELAEALTFTSMWTSVAIASERGSFGLFEQSGYRQGRLPVEGVQNYVNAIVDEDWEDLKEAIQKHGIRNSYCTTVAPTGSISMIADCSSGIEPLYALSFKKKVAIGEFYYTNEWFEKALEKEGLLTQEVLKNIVENGGTLRGMVMPKHLHDVFKTAMDLSWETHVKVQAIWQKWINNGISKTINMAKEATAQDIRSAYELAHKLGCFGLSIYRDSSRQEQVLHNKV